MWQRSPVRNLLIIVLAAACIWLFIERKQLTEDVAALEVERQKTEEKVSQAQSAAQVRQTKWLESHVESSARALEPTPRRLR